MSKWLGALLFSVTLVLGSLPLLWAAETEDDQSRPPVIAIGLQVRHPPGRSRAPSRARTRPRPSGTRPSPWCRATSSRITAQIDPKGKTLGDVRLRLDNAVLSTEAKGPWQADVDTGTLSPGHHLIEVWAELKSPDNGFRSATTTFLVVPQNDPLLQVLLPELAEAKAALPKVTDPKMTCTLGSANPTVAKALETGGPVTLDQRALLEVKAAAPATVYIYALMPRRARDLRLAQSRSADLCRAGAQVCGPRRRFDGRRGGPDGVGGRRRPDTSVRPAMSHF